MPLWDAAPRVRCVFHHFNESADPYGPHHAKEVWQPGSRIFGSLGHDLWILYLQQPANDRQVTESSGCLCPSFHIEDFRHSLTSKEMHFTLGRFLTSSRAMAFFPAFPPAACATLPDSSVTTENNAPTYSRPCFPTELTWRQHERRHVAFHTRVLRAAPVH